MANKEGDSTRTPVVQAAKRWASTQATFAFSTSIILFKEENVFWRFGMVVIYNFKTRFEKRNVKPDLPHATVV